MHSSSLTKLIGLLCVVLLCAGLSVAQTAKKTKHRRASGAASPSASAKAKPAHRAIQSADAKPWHGAANRRGAKSARTQQAKKRHLAESSASSRRSKTDRRSKTESGSGRVVPAAAHVRTPRGQQVIDQERTREIQQALIRENYLSGEASGAWDDATRQAMTRYQYDHGWQTKVTPDSRALIKLGLGPNHAGLINPGVTDSMPSGARELRPGGAAVSSN